MKTFQPIAWLLIMIIWANATEIASAQTRPNILWITIEDTSPQFIGCYGDEQARTPHIDALAREGLRFTSAFSTNTVCSPSRTALITGVNTFETGTGNHRSEIPLPDFMHGFPYYLQKAGYYTSNNSKTDYNVPNEAAFITEAWNESSKEAGWWNRKPGQPFFAVFNYNDSHQSRTMTEPYAAYEKKVLNHLTEEQRIAEEDITLPPFYRDSPEMRKQFARVYNSIALTDLKIGRLLEQLEKDGLRDSTIIFFYGDHGEGIPRGKTNAIALGYRVPFIVWVPPMYHDLLPGMPGDTNAEPVNFRDLAPTVLSLAGSSIPGYMDGRIIMGREKQEAPDYLELSNDRSDNGIELARSITDGRYFYTRNFMPFMPEARYINYMELGEIKQLMREDLAAGRLNSLQERLFEPRPAEYLYDLQNDTWETVNLAEDPAYRGLLKKMRKRLDQEVISSRDVMFLPEYELLRISENNTPYRYRLNEEDYPVKEIYAAASLSGFRDKSTIRKQLKLLKSDDPIVRYWALTGLRSQKIESLQLHKARIKKMIDDPYPPAAITAAAIMQELSGGPEVERRLKAFIASDHSSLALMALNYLIYAEDKTPFIAAVKSRLQQANNEKNINWACEDFLHAAGQIIK